MSGLHRRSLPRRDTFKGLTQLSSQDTVIFRGTTTDPTKGTIARDQISWRRVGDTMEILMAYRQTTLGSGGSGSLLVEVPGGYSIDTAKQSVTANTDEDEAHSVVGQCWTQRISGLDGWGLVSAYDATRFIFKQYDSGSRGTTTIANRLALTVDWAMSFAVQVPIVGWR